MIKALFVLGTRPEAIKLAPVIRCLQDDPAFRVEVCVTAQHRALLDQVLEAFRIRPDFDLDVMRAGQSLTQSAARILSGLEPVLASSRPDWVLVQGDTTTTFCGALASFYQNLKVAHVEAGLRTGDFSSPFPEEMNRVLATRLSALHFAPTQGSADNLLREGIPAASILVTGNTGIDAVLAIRDRLESGELQAGPLPPLTAGKKRIVVTAHRRESFGAGMEHICDALLELAARGDAEIVYPVHPNPNVRAVMHRRLGAVPAIHCLEPLEYIPFVALMRSAHLLLTDSGGIQEEAPSLGKPVLVLRDTTERPEAVDAGTARLVGTNPQRIVAEATRLLDDVGEYQRRAAIHNPYGDGHASARIRDRLRAANGLLPIS